MFMLVTTNLFLGHSRRERMKTKFVDHFAVQDVARSAPRGGRSTLHPKAKLLQNANYPNYIIPGTNPGF